MTRRLDFCAVSDSVWEAIFMLVILKIPLIYLGSVVWWAVRAEPNPAGGGDEAGVRAAPLTPCNWDDWRRSRARTRSRRPIRPSGGRVRARAQVT